MGKHKSGMDGWYPQFVYLYYSESLNYQSYSQVQQAVLTCCKCDSFPQLLYVSPAYIMSSPIFYIGSNGV